MPREAVGAGAIGTANGRGSIPKHCGGDTGGGKRFANRFRAERLLELS